MECRLSGVDFDIAASAGWYSAIAGVLTGFALLSILFPLDHETADSNETETSNAVVVFTCAFFSLLILAFTYAVLAGRTGDGPVVDVAAHEQLLNGAAFGLATLLLLFGLHELLLAYGANRQVFQPARRVIVTMTSVVGPLVVLALQFSNTLDLQRYRVAATGSSSVQCGMWGLPNGVWINLGITAVALTTVLALGTVRDRLPRRRSAPTLAAKIVLGFTVAVTGWTALVLPLLPDSAVTGALFEHLTLAVTATATVGVAEASWLGR
jgi:hypothetical protein